MRAGAAKDLYLLLQAQLLAFEFVDAQRIWTGRSMLVLDRPFQGFVTGPKFANTRFNGHRRASTGVCDGG